MNHTNAILTAIGAERRRQIVNLNFTPEYDDRHVNGALARAAAAYACAHTPAAEHAKTMWPWTKAWWKAKDARRNLIRAAALIVAEIERLDRLEASKDVEEYVVVFTYTNWRGETAVRRVRPIAVEFASTGWHPEPQWLLRGYDFTKGAERLFALKDCDFQNASGVPQT